MELLRGALYLCAIFLVARGLSIGEAEDDFDVSKEIAAAPKDTKQKCITDLGCFRTDGDFYHPIYRPISFLPMDREFINVKYRIYTAKNKSKYLLLPAVNVLRYNMNKTNINPEHETKIITHGWIDNQVFGEWMKKPNAALSESEALKSREKQGLSVQSYTPYGVFGSWCHVVDACGVFQIIFTHPVDNMKNEYMKNGNYNVIIVDWSGGNAPPYTQAVANTRVVGAEIALLVNTLKEKVGLDPRKVHIMGHSLGGQIVGYAGERIKNLGKITSFDPAEPFYQNMPPSVRIDPTDAEFVEVIHTDSKSILLLGLGMNQLAGHVDFFPNNGVEQPGCSLDRIFKIVTDGLLEGVRRLAACDHQRAVDYFHESINGKCQMVAYACKDWNTFLEGKCYDCGANGEKCAILGARSHEYVKNKNDSNPVKMYVKTHHSEPFCLYHYNVQLKLQKGTSKDKDQKGILTLTLKGSKNSETFQLGNGAQDLYPGATYPFLITTQKDLGDIQTAIFKWKSSRFSIFSTPKISLEKAVVTPMFEIEQNARKAATRQFCWKHVGPITSGKDASSKLSNEC